jgi:hypothetical protein
MTKYLKKMMEGNNIRPPGLCLESFHSSFRNAINAEWSQSEGGYESVFYEDGLEHIARFDASGLLLEYKMFLPENLLPEKIREQLVGRGEVMHAVLINKGNLIEYDVIIRDPDFQRFQMTYSQTGDILMEQML